MDDKTFNLLFTEALAASDRDAFVSEWGGSSLFAGDPDDPGPDLAVLIPELERVYDLAHLSVREIRQRAGLTQAAFGLRYCIPRRTLEDWEAGRRLCPPYVRLLLARSAE